MIISASSGSSQALTMLPKSKSRERQVNKNLQRYAGSDNADINEQYNAARTLIATVLRATRQIADDKDTSLQALGQLKADIDKYDIVDNGTLDSLIREDRITPEMASSLINDSGYTQNISRNLIDAGLIVLQTGPTILC